MDKKIVRCLASILLIFAGMIGVLIYKFEVVKNENMQLQKSRKKIKIQLAKVENQLKNEFPSEFLTEDREGMRDYTLNSEKIKKYKWYSGIITEFNYCNTDSILFDQISSYKNPVDLALMEYLDGRRNTSEVARRSYQEQYCAAWRKEFYNVASLIYKTIKYDEEKETLSSYVKAIESMIESKQDEIIINIYSCNTTPIDEKGGSLYWGNGTYSWLKEEAALIYRTEALNMIKQYNQFLEDSMEKKSKTKNASKYKYLTAKIADIKESDLEMPVPDYFKNE